MKKKLPKPIPEQSEDAPGLRKINVEGNKRPWNGVDYSDFPEKSKMLIRKHLSLIHI